MGEAAGMAYVIGEPCVDVLDRACEPACPVEAIYYEDDLPDGWKVYAGENARFFVDPLPGRDQPLGSPGGAARTGKAGADTLFVAALSPRE
jgi:ferredoxin